MQADSHTLQDFTAALASADPAPGGGGAAALSGALAASLAAMVANLTTGKKKYAEFEDDIQRILADAEALRQDLLTCIDEDETGFLPLAQAYGIPKDDPARDSVMEAALRTACAAPLKIMKLAANSIALHAELAEKGSALMVSDVGVGAVLGKAALIGASLNVRININMMKDRANAAMLISEAEDLLKTYTAMADEAYDKILLKLSD